MSAQRTEELSKAIIEKVNSYWDTNQHACLLSLLGKMLNEDGFNSKAILVGRKLKDYISAELSSELKVLHPSGNPVKVGVIPVSADVSKGIETLFVSPESSEERVPHFPYAFWAAFTKPISAGKIRTLKLRPKIQFQDLPNSTVENEELVVEEQLITPRENLNSVEYKAKVYSNIKSWLKLNNIRENDLLTGLPNPASEPEVGRVESSSLLYQVLNALTEEQLHRVSLPLDIVSKLAKVQCR